MRNGRDHAYLPISVQGFRCYQDKVEEAWAHTRLRSVGKDGTRVVDVRVYDAAERPVAELQGLTVRWLPLAKVQAPEAAADDPLYRACWRKSARPAVGNQTRRAPASWIVFADRNRGAGAALARTLEATGHHCHLVYSDGAFARPGPQEWTVNAQRPEDFRRMLEQCADGETLPCEGVVYLWGLDAPAMMARSRSG